MGDQSGWEKEKAKQDKKKNSVGRKKKKRVTTGRVEETG